MNTKITSDLVNALAREGRVLFSDGPMGLTLARVFSAATPRQLEVSIILPPVFINCDESVERVWS